MLTLFDHPLSPYAQKVKIALYEKGIPFATVLPELEGEAGGELAAVNPRREVPALVDGEVRVFDSTIILEYLEDRWPDPPLLPAEAAERARVRMLEELCDTYYEAVNWGIAEIRFFGRATGELADRMLARAGEQIAGVHARLERELADRPFFNGADFGWGDAAVWPHVSTSAALGFPPPGASLLAAWMEGVGSRDSLHKIRAAALTALAEFQNLGALVQSGELRREYRDHRLEWMMRSGGESIVRDGLASNNIRFSVEID